MIRCATLEDLNRIIELAKEASLFNYGSTLYATLIRRGKVFVAVDGHYIIGYVIVFKLFMQTAFCLQVAVSTDSREKGFGSTLIEYAESHMKTNNVKRMFAHTTKNRSFQYFINKLNYHPLISLGWFRIIQKNLRPHQPDSA